MHELKVLLKARRQAFANRTKHAGGHRIVLVAAVVLAAVLAALGYLSAPSLLELPEDVITPRLGERKAVVGESALEASFWLTALVCAVSSFRVMELLFRREDVRVVALLPISGGALFWDRLLAGFIEAMAFGVVLWMFFAPLAFMGHPIVAFVTAKVVFGGLVSTQLVTMAVILWMGGQYGGSRAMGDAYGGQGGAFIYAPGAALAGSIITLLLIQLTMTQVLAAGTMTRAAWLGTGITFAIWLVSLRTAHSWMKQAYHQASAFFAEAESVAYEIDTEYQTSAMAQPHWVERLVGQNLSVRKFALQGGRKNALQRYLFGFFVIVTVFAAFRFREAALPTWVLALLPSMFFVAVTPWDRTRAHDMGMAHAEYLGLTARREVMGESTFLISEMMLVGIAIAASILGFRGLGTENIGLAVFAVLTPSAMVGALSILGAKSNRALRLVVAVTFVLVSGVVAVVAPMFTALVAIVAHIGYMKPLSSASAIRAGEYR